MAPVSDFVRETLQGLGGIERVPEFERGAAMRDTARCVDWAEHDYAPLPPEAAFLSFPLLSITIWPDPGNS